MNLRDRFLAVMNFSHDVHSIKWEFGYWGETIHKWYAEGLPQVDYARLSKAISTPTSTLYAPAWTCQGTERMPNGIAAMAGGLYHPTQGFPLDRDVRNHFGMDDSQRLVDVNLLFCPMFDITVHEENEQTMTYTDVDGVKRIFLKQEATIPTSLAWPIKDRMSWEQVKSERLSLSNLKDRFPANWGESVAEYNNRDYPLAVGGYPHGFFGTLAHLIGYENLFQWYYLEPELVHDILGTFTNIWLAVYEEVLSKTEVDHWQIWEDISFGKGSMISLDMVREFLLPYIKRIGDFLKAKGVNIILLDTDGDCNDLIPLFMEAGVTGMYPFETKCGMDIVKVRQKYPKLQILGGIPKSDIHMGRKRIDEFLEPVDRVLQTGGYIPFGDHFIPPDVDFENFSYYRRKLNALIDKYGN